MIPEGYYYKTTQEKKPSPPPKETPVVKYILVSISIPIALTLFEKVFDLNIVFGEPQARDEQPGNPDPTPVNPDFPPNPPVPPDPNPPVPPDPSPPVPPNPSPPVSPNPSPPIPPNPVKPNRICIPRYCNGHRAGSANFRSFPSLSSSAIRGVIPVGECVFLTGFSTTGDGILWYESINESLLTASLEFDAQNRLEVGQRGWIAACFIDQL